LRDKAAITPAGTKSHRLPLMTQGVTIHREGQWELKGGVEQAVAKIPESLRQMIAQQIKRLKAEERQVLEVASVVGAEFSAAAVAAGVGTAIEEVEEKCGELVRREQFLRMQGIADWPDGTVATRYGFRHALYQEVLYESFPARRRIRLHQQIGEREEQAYGTRAGEIAAELAMHFERGREHRKAVQYLHQAGENAIRRAAYQEAITLLTKGLELLQTLPNTSERVQQELPLQITLGPLLGMTQDFAAPEVETAYVRARELYQQVEATPQLFPILAGLCGFYLLRPELQTARELAEQLLTLL
jgi:predicted ATPase